jgi:hypothetical protein
MRMPEVGRRPSRGVLVLLGAVALWLAGCSVAPGGSSVATVPPTRAPDIHGSFPVGPWASEVTEKDWAGTGIPNIEENTGRFVVTFEPDGRWTSMQTSLTGMLLREPIFRGTYTATATTIRLVTDYPDRYVGFVDMLSWRLEGEALHLVATEASDEYIVIIYGAHPWYRP